VCFKVEVSASLLGVYFACLGEEVGIAGDARVDSFHLDFRHGLSVVNDAFTPHLTSLRQSPVRTNFIVREDLMAWKDEF